MGKSKTKGGDEEGGAEVRGQKEKGGRGFQKWAW